MNSKYSDSEIRRMIHRYHIKENLENDESPAENENYKGLADECYYSIIEDYTPDCPGWTGDVLTVIYGAVEAIENYLIEDGRLITIKDKEDEWYSSTADSKR